jgi:hypothetical protein
MTKVRSMRKRKPVDYTEPDENDSFEESSSESDGEDNEVEEKNIGDSYWDSAESSAGEEAEEFSAHKVAGAAQFFFPCVVMAFMGLLPLFLLGFSFSKATSK